MSRFYFDTTAASDILRELTGIKNAMDNAKSLMNNVVTSAEANDGFGIFDIIEQLRSEIRNLGKCGLYAESGAKTLSEIINSLDNNAKAVVNVANTFVLAGAEAIQSVIMSSENKTDNNVLGNTQQNKPENIQQEKNPLEGYPAGSWMNDEGQILIPNNSNSIKIVDSETGGKNYVMLAPTGMGVFERGGYRGYKQTTKDGLGGWFHSDYQCVATAMATTSMYNGIYETPYDRYSAYDYENGVNGCAVGCYWSGYGEIGPQEFTDYCVNRLIDGKATTIYAHADYSHDTGHAATVVGYVNRGSANPMYDLIVVDPWTGDSYFLFESYNMTHGKNGYFTFDAAN